MSTLLTLVAALGRNSAIGKDSRLLWQLPEDMQRFKALTFGHSVLMGRKTWESLPAKFRPLPGRQNIVLSRNPHYQLPDAVVARTLDQGVSVSADSDLFVVGGAEIYGLAIAIAARLELTEVDDAPAADAFFPAFRRIDWRETRRVSRPASANAPAYAFVTYTRATQSTK